MKLKKALCLIAAAVMLILTMTSCGSQPDRPEFAYDETAPSLCEAFADYFKVGAAINSWDLNDENTDKYKIISKHFNTFVLENETKADHMHPSENTYNFAATDKFAEFGEKVGATLRGHCLVWHSQWPGWIFKDGSEEASADLVVERMKEHITTIVTHYKGKIHTWDVVNEVLDGGGMRFSDWLKIVGDYDGDGDKYDFIEIAFRTARECDPDARLIINDYSLETDTNKAIKMYNMCKQMMSEGVPVDGVGLQMHIGIDLDVEKARENIAILAKLKDINPDFVIEVTELDMSCFSWGDDSTTIDFKKIEKQFNQKYTEVFEMFMDLSEQGLLDSVVFWGYNDGNSWLNGTPEGRVNHPFLIDADLKFKSSFWEVTDLPNKRK